MMTFESIKSTALSFAKMLRKAFDFRGRASIEEFSLFALLSIVISHILAAGVDWINLTAHINSVTYSVLYAVYFILISVPVIAAWVRRLHDTGRCGAWIFLLLIPIIGAVILTFMTIRSSQPEDNKYGSLLSQKNKS
ncbi:MAG: DUF805 domain-containing protein [Phycisphaerae bacterium]